MLKYVLSFFWKSSEDAPSLPLEEAYNVIRECENDTEQETAPIEIQEEIKQYETVNKTGIVTKVCDKLYEVDNLYEFESELDDIFVGTKVQYQLLKVEGQIKVADVHVLENDWSVEPHNGKTLWHERTLVCSVVNRDGRVVTLSPGNISINLNTVSSEFIPIVGDWLELDVKCEIDEQVLDLNGKIIEVSRLRALRPQIRLGKVSKWDLNTFEGLMDMNVFFNKDSLYCGYIPCKGDKVIAEIIESNQGFCTWRALRIIPDHLHLKNKENNCDNYFDPNVSITDNVTLMFTKVGECKVFLMEIETRQNFELICIEIPKTNGQCRLITDIDHCKLKANSSLTVRIECKAKFGGESREMVIFHFDSFKLARWITIQVAADPRKHSTDKKPKTVISRERNREVIRGEKITTGARFVPVRMPDFAVPDKLFDLVSRERQNAGFSKRDLEQMKPCLVTPLSYMNFEDKFHTLLHLDEIHTMLEMQNYDQERACFIRNGEYFMLEIENLSERRPSVIQGDRVIARSIRDSNSPDYEGYIHKTSKDHVYIKFSKIFHDSYDGEDYSVFIIASRVTYRRKHFAINLAVRNLGKDFLFPSRVQEKEAQLDFAFEERNANNLKTELLRRIQQFNETKDRENHVPPVPKLTWYNQSLNFYQKEAVRNILLGVCRPLPYIIFGPPGTGKTVTIVEVVLQILRLIPHSRILLSAPSNSAADLLALRLIEAGVLKPGDLIRLVAISAISGIPAKLAPYCATANVEKEGTQTSLPVVTTNGLVLGYSSSVLGRHRITVTTCSSAGLLYSMGFSKGHFSHIIVDEAGQTSEPSVLIPLAFLDTSNGQAVLAGDPMQLGPVVLSRLACEYGLEESFLERMINRFPFARDIQGFPKTAGYDPRLITKLILNYRSLPDILKLPSMLFYNDDLEATISDSESQEADLLRSVSPILPQNTKGNTSSIVFHAVFGKNQQTDDSPSWFNASEAAQVFYYVNELYRFKVSCNDIGIITPYKAQVKQLIGLFNEADFDCPKIGTVEEFQGQEYKVIILSPVRSCMNQTRCDLQYKMGFVSSPRRLNVAITRAKVLLIIVGNPEFLSGDGCWRSVIQYCNEKGSLTGATQKSKKVF